MKCDVQQCPNPATHIRGVPLLGEDLCFCESCVNGEIQEYGEDFGWKKMTPEEIVDIERGQEQMREMLRKAFGPLKKK